MAGTSERRIPLPGSNRAVPEGATLVGDVDPDERITVVVYVKRRTPDEFTPGSAGDLARLARPVTRRQLATQRHRSHASAAARITRLAALAWLLAPPLSLQKWVDTRQPRTTSSSAIM